METKGRDMFETASRFVTAWTDCRRFRDALLNTAWAARPHLCNTFSTCSRTPHDPFSGTSRFSSVTCVVLAVYGPVGIEPIPKAVGSHEPLARSALS